jgi:hypothetical protein
VALYWVFKYFFGCMPKWEGGDPIYPVIPAKKDLNPESDTAKIADLVLGPLSPLEDLRAAVTVPHLLFRFVAGFEPFPEGFEFLEIFLVLGDFGCPSLKLHGGGCRRSVLVFERVSSRQGLGGFSVDELGSIVLIAS